MSSVDVRFECQVALGSTALCLARQLGSVHGTMVEVDNAAPTRVNKERVCRDVFFLIFFVLFWIGMLVCAGVAFSRVGVRG